jgi:signal transduction histidine kinase
MSAVRIAPSTVHARRRMRTRKPRRAPIPVAAARRGWRGDARARRRRTRARSDAANARRAMAMASSAASTTARAMPPSSSPSRGARRRARGARGGAQAKRGRGRGRRPPHAVASDDEEAQWTPTGANATAPSNALALSRSDGGSQATTLTAARESEVDLFARFAHTHAELVARMMSNDDDGDDAKCMIYLRGSGGTTSMRLTRVAAWPRRGASTASTNKKSTLSFTGDWDEGGFDTDISENVDDDEDGASAIDWDAPEDTLASQKTFDLPSANAVVACLAYEESLIGLIVVERMGRDAVGDASVAFTKKQRKSLEVSASAFVDAWAIHRNNVVAVAAAYRADQTVGGYLYESRQPLTALRTLGGMLKTYLKPDDPAGDMAEALVQQGDALAELSVKLESALYPNSSIEQRGVLYGASGGRTDVSEKFLTDGTRARVTSNSMRTDALTVVSSDEMCDVTKVVITLLATSDVVATSSGLAMRATLPESENPETVVYASPKDVRSALAQIIDLALMAAPRGAVIDVAVEEPYARDVQTGVGVEVKVDASLANGSVYVDTDAPSMRIARRLIQRAGGVLECDNEPGGDTMAIRVRYPSREYA